MARSPRWQLKNNGVRSAPLQPRLSRVFCAAGMQVMEGYGLTETSPVVSVGKYDNKYFKVGTVGKPLMA